MSIRKRLGALLLGVALLAGTSACAGPGATTPSSDAAAGTLTVASLSAPSSLDPAISGNGSDGVFQQLAYEPLIRVGASGDLEPGIATSWDYQGSDNTVLKVKLRADVKFADGTPVTPADVAASLNYFAKNGKGPASAAFSAITAAVDGVDGVTLTSAIPNPIIPSLISTHYLAGNIISPAGLADPTTLATATFGAGPYVYDAAQSVSGDQYVFTPNENYFEPDLIHFEKIVVKVISNPSSALQALKAGQVDFASGDATTAADASSAGLQVLNAPSSWVGAFNIDSDGATVKAMADVRVRQALNYAVNREEIAKAVYGEFGSVVDQPNVPGWDAFDDSLEGTYPFDAQKAKDLLAAAGASDLSFRWAYPSYEAQTAKVVQAVAAQFGAVGIKVDLDGAANLGELIGFLTDGKHSLLSLAWGGQSQFANTYQLWLPTSQLNPHQVVTPGLQELFTTYAASSEADRDATAGAVQKLAVEQGLTVPVAKIDSIYFLNKSVKGAALTPRGLINSIVYWTK